MRRLPFLLAAALALAFGAGVVGSGAGFAGRGTGFTDHGAEFANRGAEFASHSARTARYAGFADRGAATVVRSGVADRGSTGATDDGPSTLVPFGSVRLWPYVAPARSFDHPASSMNVVVRTDPGRVRRYLAGRGGWNRTDGERVDDPADEPGVVDETVAPWSDAPGAHRYTYVAGRGWISERYQLHRGAYFGSRFHLRAYGPRGGNWTAIQAHDEHWDWFTISHTVDGVEDAQRRVESAFLGKPGFEVRRVYSRNGDTYDADGWTTVVVVALLPLVTRRRLRRRLRGLAGGRNRRRAALAGSLAGLVLAVRFGAIACWRYLPGLSPDAVVAVWYPVLVAGTPLAAYRFGRRLPPAEAGAFAGAGVGLGIVADYAYLGVNALPIPVAVHRAVVVLAVALLAAGAGSTDADAASTGIAGDAAGHRPALRAGALLWVAVVVAGHLV